MPWTLRAGRPGPYKQQIHLYLGLGEVLVEHAIPVEGTFGDATIAAK
jgi:hypothetical protein